MYQRECCSTSRLRVIGHQPCSCGNTERPRFSGIKLPENHILQDDKRFDIRAHLWLPDSLARARHNEGGRPCTNAIAQSRCIQLESPLKHVQLLGQSARKRSAALLEALIPPGALMPRSRCHHACEHVRCYQPAPPISRTTPFQSRRAGYAGPACQGLAGAPA